MKSQYTISEMIEQIKNEAKKILASKELQITEEEKKQDNIYLFVNDINELRYLKIKNLYDRFIEKIEQKSNNFSTQETSKLAQLKNELFKLMSILSALNPEKLIFWWPSWAKNELSDLYPTKGLTQNNIKNNSNNKTLNAPESSSALSQVIQKSQAVHPQTKKPIRKVIDKPALIEAEENVKKMIKMIIADHVHMWEKQVSYRLFAGEYIKPDPNIKKYYKVPIGISKLWAYANNKGKENLFTIVNNRLRANNKFSKPLTQEFYKLISDEKNPAELFKRLSEFYEKLNPEKLNFLSSKVKKRHK